MSNKNINNRFTEEDVVNAKEFLGKSGHEEYDELIELGRSLSSMDFSKDSNKDAVLKKIKNNIDFEGIGMNKTKRIKRIATIAATLAFVVITFMQTTFAQEIIERVKDTISLGHITGVQVEHSQKEAYVIPQELRGKIFDKNGKPLEVISKENAGEIYSANGEKIYDITNGEIITAEQRAENHKEQMLIVKDVDKLNDYTCFKVILPTYLPDGYKLDRAEFYKDEAGNVKKTKYIDLHFVNETTKNEIFMQQRFADDETAYEFSTDNKIEKTKINGVEAILEDNEFGVCINWEYNGVLYMASGKGNLDRNEMIKFVESIK